MREELAKKQKEAAKLAWWVKGRIFPWIFETSEEELDKFIDSYTRRLWGNEEAYLYENGDKFEEEWKKAYTHNFFKERAF